MNKVLIEIHIPSIYDHFDVFVPSDVALKELHAIIADGVSEITNGKFVASGSEQLCSKDPCGLLNPALTLQDYGIKDGAKMYLI